MTEALQHRAVVAGQEDALPEEKRPESGPIALLPAVSETGRALVAREPLEAAILAGGGTIAELSSESRGLVWLTPRRPEELSEIVVSNPGIGWVQLPFAGVDAFSEAIAAHPEILWTSAKGAYAQPVAEHALTLSLAMLRLLPKRARAKRWSTIPEGRSLYGLKVVIVGAGGIALELIRLLEPFQVDITIVRRSADPVRGTSRTVPVAQLDDVLPEADIVVVAAALTGGTTKLFGAPQFEAMKDTAYLINIARGGLVDTDALATALSAGTIGGAAMDVTDPEPLPDGHPLWDEPNCLITPHSADTPEMIAPLLAERVRLNVEALVSGNGRFVGVVDPTQGY